MPTGYFSGVFGEIILFAFRLFISAVLLRFLLHWVRADFRFNPLARALVKITNPALTPLRRFIPGYKGVDWAAIVLMLALAMIGIPGPRAKRASAIPAWIDNPGDRGVDDHYD